jgi:hypothetical protein
MRIKINTLTRPAIPRQCEKVPPAPLRRATCVGFGLSQRAFEMKELVQ